MCGLVHDTRLWLKGYINIKTINIVFNKCKSNICLLYVVGGGWIFDSNSIRIVGSDKNIYLIHFNISIKNEQLKNG